MVIFTRNIVWTNFFIGGIFPSFLALLAIIDTGNYPDPHLYFAVAFFVLSLIYLLLNTIVYKMILNRRNNVHLR
jgi:hypothetical protein